MVDAAHNPQSAQVLARELSRKFVTAAAPDCLARAQEQGGARPIPTLLLGVLADKDVRGVVRALVPLFNDVVVTASRSPRAIPPESLAAVVVECGGAQPRVVPDVAEALDLLGGTPTLATGSITVAGEVKQLWC